MSEIYGYVRVSTKEQNESRQLIALSEYSIPEGNIFIDKESGKNFDRSKYKKLVKRLKEGDMIYIKSIDRLGRNYEEIIEQWRIISKTKKADIYVIDMPLLDTRRGKDLMGTFISDLVLEILSFVAHNERDMIRQRQKEGIEAARQRGVKFGRPIIPLPDNFDEAYCQWTSGQISLKEAARVCGMTESTFYRRARTRKDSSMKMECQKE